MKIAIVGNSPCILNKEWGQEIDNHDLIVRFNNYDIKEHSNCTGVRTNFLIVSDGVAETTFLHKHKFLSLDKEHRLFMTYIGEDAVNLIDESLHKGDALYFGKELFDDIKAKMKKLNPINYNDHWPCSGILAMTYFSNLYPDAEIDVYGVSFFAEKYIHYFDKCQNRYHDANTEKMYFDEYLKNKVNLHI